MTRRTIIDESFDVLTYAEVDRIGGEVYVWHITEDDDGTIDRTLIGFPAHLAGQIGAAIVAAGREILA